jgi:acyl carrier protein
MSNAEGEVLRIMSEICGVPLDRLQPEVRLVQDLGIDSVVTLDLLLELEEALGLEIPEIEAAEMQTVGQVLKYVREHAAA